MDPKEAIALVSGHVSEEILLRREYLAAENKILKRKLEGMRIKFTPEEKMRLACLGKKLGEKALADIGCIVTPGTVMGW